MFGVTISARGRKARSCENTGPHQQKNVNYHILIWSVWWRGAVRRSAARCIWLSIRRPQRDNKITGRNKVSSCWSRFLFLICCEGGDILQDQYLVPSRDQSRLHVLKAFYRRSIPNTSATTYTTTTCLFILVWSSCWLAGQVPLLTASHTASPSQ